MNLIYICVFQEKYINLLYLLIQSIYNKGCINKETTDIIILTEHNFFNKIITLLAPFNLPIKCEILNITTLFESSWAKLNIIKYVNFHLYEKILYLDTNILINNDVNILFNLDLDLNIDKNKIYALEEGTIAHPFWGGQFFDFELTNININTSAFTSNILLFFNTCATCCLFHDIINHIMYYNQSHNDPICMEQPFIVYNAVMQNKYDNQILKQYAENNPIVDSNKIIYHFPGIGIVSNYNDKYNKMVAFWEIIKEKEKEQEQEQKIKIKICHHGNDGFGHQLEGTLRLLSLSLNNKAQYDNRYKIYKFEHYNFDIQILIKFFTSALNALNINSTIDTHDYNIKHESRSFHDILIQDKHYSENIYFYDGVGNGSRLPNNFESKQELEKSLPLLRDVFVTNNIYLPSPSYNKEYINVCCHIRLGDAVGQRRLDNDNLYNIIRCFQKKNNFRITIHSDGNIDHLSSNNTILHNKYTDVLQIFSDFVNSDILLINYSALSIAAHLISYPKQIVICPDNAGVTFKDRILDKCITCSQFMQKIL